jgi:alkanesulfonate monooxygenase SsuD/methylene tetrahydromethanopterin reductase-like flavin-dependent oxidoreductase (luciferase family)
MIFSVAQTVCCGATENELRRRAESAARAGPFNGDVDALRGAALTGSPAELAERLAAFAEIGAQRAYLQVLDLRDLDHLELLATLIA